MHTAGAIKHDQFFKRFVLGGAMRPRAVFASSSAVAAATARTVAILHPRLAHGFARQHAIANGDHALHLPGNRRVMADDNRGDTHFVGQLAESVVDELGRHRIHFAGRFVGQQQRRVIGQGYGDGNALLFAAGKLRKLVMFAPLQPHQVEQFVSAAALVARQPGDGHRQHDVFDGVEIGDQVACALLPDKAHLLAPVAVELRVTHAQEVVAIHAHAPRRRAIQPTQDVHERRLAAARSTDDRHQLAALDGQVQLAQRHLLQPGNLIDFDQPVTDDKWLTHTVSPNLIAWNTFMRSSRTISTTKATRNRAPKST